MDAGLGVKSILQRSVWLKNKSFKESLMRITALCSETEINSYVQNLDDFKELIVHITPAMKDFLDNCFMTSRITAEITNITWMEEDDLLVKESPNSGVLRKDVSNEDGLQNLNVETRALRVDWIKNQCYGYDYPGYGAVYKIMRLSEDTGIFDTDFARTIEDYCNEIVTITVRRFVIIPYIIYLICGTYYIIYVVAKGDDNSLMTES